MSLDASEFFIRINDHGPELVDTNSFFVLPPPPLGVQNSPPSSNLIAIAKINQRGRLIKKTQKARIKAKALFKGYSEINSEHTFLMTSKP